jgi:hypothetical protein
VKQLENKTVWMKTNSIFVTRGGGSVVLVSGIKKLLPLSFNEELSEMSGPSSNEKSTFPFSSEYIIT